MTHEYIEPLNDTADKQDLQHLKIDELVTVANVVGGDISTLTVSGNLDVNQTMCFADATAGAMTITLYHASKRTGTQINISKTDSSANIVTIDAQSTETIDGETTQTLETQYDNLTIISDGTNWKVL